MKKIVLFTLIFVLSLTVSVSASAFGWGKIGVRGTYHTAGLSSEGAPTVRGGGGGIAVNVYLPVPGMAVQPELNYIYKCDRQMLEIPVNFQIGLDLVLVRPFICVTPYLNLPLSTGGNLEVNPFQAGFGIGGGIDLWRFQIQCRYNWNITDFYKNETGKLRGVDLGLVFFF